MKKLTLISAIAVMLAASIGLQAQSLHRLPIKTVQDLHAYFNWSPTKLPIISGHRGGMGTGFAENSLASFEYTLKYTAAFFETDPRLTNLPPAPSK